MKNSKSLFSQFSKVAPEVKVAVFAVFMIGFAAIAGEKLYPSTRPQLNQSSAACITDCQTECHQLSNCPVDNRKGACTKSSGEPGVLCMVCTTTCSPTAIPTLPVAPTMAPTAIPSISSPASPVPTVIISPTISLIPTGTVKPGDANNDGKVDGVDYVVWRTNFNQHVTGPSFGDFDNNGYVDGVDYVIWRNNYGK